MQQQVDIWWHELNTWDALEARNFYRHTLGWSFEQITLPDGEPYWLARKNGKTIGGIYSLSAPKFRGIPSHWMTYMAVDDLDQAERDTTSSGGEVTRPATEIPGIGRIAIVTDASGALIGLIEPDTEQFDLDAAKADHDLLSDDDSMRFTPEAITLKNDNSGRAMAS